MSCVGRLPKKPLFVIGVKIKLNIMLELRMFYLMLLVRISLLVFIARRLLMKFGKSLRPFVLGLQSFVMRSTKCLRKNSMISKYFPMNWMNKCMLD